MDQTQRLAWAARAATELELTEAGFERLRAGLVDKLFQTPMEASALRERIYGAVTVLDEVRQMLHQAVYDRDMISNDVLLAEHGFQH